MGVRLTWQNSFQFSSNIGLKSFKQIVVQVVLRGKGFHTVLNRVIFKDLDGHGLIFKFEIQRVKKLFIAHNTLGLRDRLFLLLGSGLFGDNLFLSQGLRLLFLLLHWLLLFLHDSLLLLNLSRGQIFLVFFDLLSLLRGTGHLLSASATAFIVVLIIGSIRHFVIVVVGIVPLGSTALICIRLVVFEALAPLLIVGLLAAILLLVVISGVLVIFNMTIASSGPIVHIAPVILVTASIVVVILHILAAIALVGAIFIIAHVVIVLSLLVTTSHGTAISHDRPITTTIVGADIARRLQRTILFFLVLLLLLLLLLPLLGARRDVVDSTATLVVVAVVVALVAIVSVAARLLVAIILHAIIIVAI